MTERLRHRGPDGDGLWVEGHCGLGHRRLAIIDPGGGAQPLANETGEVVVTFNGEIYNHRELRRWLESCGHSFRTNADTEVLVHGYEECGREILSRLNGMFAFAIRDARNDTLLLARDRLGIKPLYYCDTGRTLLFASELTALLEHPEIIPELDPESVWLYMQHEFVPAPESILRGVRKLLPGEYLETSGAKPPQRGTYWRLDYEPKTPAATADLQTEFVERLDTSIQRRLMSDVPLGAFLSGGIDSSAIVWRMSELTGDAISTFHIGFADASYDESSHARAVACHFRTRHHTERFELNADDLTQEFLGHIDEPLADLSCLPTLLVCRLARQEVTVCLSGDGADELLAGYERHVASLLNDRFYRLLPRPMRQTLARRILQSVRPSSQKKRWQDKLRRFVDGAEKPECGRQLRWQTFVDADWAARLFREPPDQSLIWRAVNRVSGQTMAASRLDQELDLERSLYLPDSVLSKVDRMSMQVGLEVRVPFLDHEVVEFVARLPCRLKWQGRQRKWLLRRVAEHHLPAETTRRGKQGFGIPMKQWLRETLFDRVQAAFAAPEANLGGLWDPAVLQQMLEEHRENRHDYSHQLWSAYVLISWWTRCSRLTPRRHTSGNDAAGSREALAPSLIPVPKCSAVPKR